MVRECRERKKVSGNVPSVPGFKFLNCVSVVSGALFLQGCTDFIRNQTIYTTSPDGQWKLVIATVGIKPELRVYLEGRHSSRTVYSDWGEWYISFVKTYWSADSKICGLYIIGDRSQLLAFEAKTGKQIDSTLVRDAIGREIVKKYHLEKHLLENPSFDPFAWAKTREAQIAYETFGTDKWRSTE